MLGSTDNGWKAFDMMNALSNLPNNMKPIFADIIRSAMKDKELSNETKDIIAWACFHSTFPITDDEVEKWNEEITA